MPPGGGKGKGGSTSKVEIINSGTTNVDADSTVEIQGLDNVKLTLALPQPLQTKSELVVPQPFRTENRQEIAVTEPVVTDSKNAMSLDIRPLTVDLCTKTSLGPLPPTCIRQPYQHHFGFTLFGVEWVGMSFSGESQMIVQDLPKQPHVTWGSSEPPHPHSHAHHRHEPHDDRGSESGHESRSEVSSEPRAGLRIRLG
jgi:hypothetical protein